MRRRTFLSAALSALTVGAGGCGREPASPGTPAPGVTLKNDQKLLDAAARLGPVLEKFFAHTYAGMELDHVHHRMIVYRRPGRALDTAVRNQAGDIQIEFRDAKYSLASMRSLAARILADRPYWEEQGVHIQSVGPSVDGSSVRVGTREGAAGQARLFGARYGPGSVTIEKRTIILA